MDSKKDLRVLNGTRENRTVDIIITILITFGALLMIYPLLWMFSTSFRLASEAYKLPPALIPESFNFKNYVDLFKSDIPFGKLFLNSFKITGVIIIGQVFFCTTAAYSFARLKFPGRDFLFGLLLVALMIPVQATLIPVYIGMSKLKLIDSHFSIILPGLVNAFGIFLLRQFFKTLPQELVDSGKIDGAGHWTIFWRIALPQATASVVTLIILTFNTVWNNYFIPLIFINSWDKMTVPLGIAALRSFMGTGNLSQIMAAVTVAIIPILIVFLFGQKYIIEGLTTTGLKG